MVLEADHELFNHNSEAGVKYVHLPDSTMY